MSDTALTARSGCKACGAQPSPMATTQPTWCGACGACINCGEPNIIAQATLHRCPGGTAAVHDVGHLLLASAVRPGYQHSPATYVEGREAPKREGPACAVCGHGYAFHHASLVGCTAGSELGSCQCSKYTDAATVEACARAAYEASLTAPQIGAHGQAIMDPEWSALGSKHRGYWIAIARAVLAAAKGAGR